MLIFQKSLEIYFQKVHPKNYIVYEEQNQNLNSPPITYRYSSSIQNLYAHYYYTEKEVSRDDLVRLRENLAPLKIDVIYVNALIDRSKKSLFTFDMDSTLIKEEVIDELARKKGVYDLDGLSYFAGC